MGVPVYVELPPHVFARYERLAAVNGFPVKRLIAVAATEALMKAPGQHGRNGATTAKVAELHARGMSDLEIARRIGISRSAVADQRNKLGLPAYKRRPIIDPAELKKLWADGLTDSEIASRLECGVMTVNNARRKQGLPSQRERKTHE